MPLPLPRLDHRTFDQLVEEGRALLPRLAPGWTDHNLHDPGITLIDLLAWLVEQDMYRLDRTSPAAYRAFLRLVGYEPRPVQVAETALIFKVASGSAPVHLPCGVQVQSQTGDIKFQTSRKLSVWPARLTVLLSGSVDNLLDQSARNRTNAKRFAPFGPAPQPGDALYLGFDGPLAPARATVSLYVWANAPETDIALRRRLIEARRADTAALPPCRHASPHRRVSWRQHYSARTVWEYYGGANGWTPLAGVVDETRGLSLSGAVRFIIPENEQHAQGGVENHPTAYFIRCRLTQGYYDCPPEISLIALNAVPACHAIEIKVEEEVGKSDGRASQKFRLKNAPVTPGSSRVQVQVDGKIEEWAEAPNWDRLGPHDRAYVLSPATGEITFGDGRYGRVPQAGAAIKVTYYQSGGGPEGNVRAQTLTRVVDAAGVSVEQPFAAAGGAEAESLAEAKGRAVAWLSEPARAVTLADFERIALATPAVPVGRAYALADYDPAQPCLPAVGSVTVVVVPGCANPLPEPGLDMVRAVERYLDRRRLLAAELHVIGPRFVTVAVRATLHAGAGADAGGLIATAQSRLNTFLDPLRGGDDGQGWPFGREVYQSEMMALLNAIPGVDFVAEVGLAIESELDVYQGNVTWMQLFQRAESTTTLRAQLRLEPQRTASRVIGQARTELEHYFQSPRGRSRHISPAARRSDVALILSGVPGVISVQNVKLEDEPGSSALCGNVPVCAHSLIVPGKHQISVSGARTGTQLLAGKPPC